LFRTDKQGHSVHIKSNSKKKKKKQRQFNNSKEKATHAYYKKSHMPMQWATPSGPPLLQIIGPIF
jgi:hypothetical protein